MRRTGPARVIDINAKARARQRAAELVITIVGAPAGMTPEVARALEAAIDKGRRIREGSAS